MKIALTQMETAWEDIGANEKIVRRLAMRAAKEGADIVVFPEFTFTGFTKTPEKFCDTEENPRQLEFVRRLSEEAGIAVVSGRIRAASPHPRNSLAFAAGGETLLAYDKIHSYSFGGETEVYSRGEEIAVAEFGGIVFGAFICYDLRFPEIFQAAAKKAQAIFVIGNWPQDRIENWQTLLRARALETQCYVLGANRSGEGGGIVYGPSSVAFDPAGRRITEASDDELVFCEIDAETVRGIRETFPLRADRREDVYASVFSATQRTGV